ncbi:MAG: hypothetical protein KGI27_15035, partial [Thaumarchaeota archaeon]|nr:hypothetical protein [Nitrososphaerota archaeon]
MSSATAIIPGGTAGKVTGTGAFSSFQPSLLVNPSGLNTWSVIIENVSEITTLLGIYDDTQALEVSYYSYTWGTGIVAFISGYAPDHSATVQNLGTGPNGGKLIKFSVSGTGATGKTISAHLYPDAQSNTSNVLIVHSAQFETDSNATSIISTTTSPVTVTDYSLTSSILTFSTAPEVNASLTWQDASSNIFNFGVGNGSTTVYNLGVEYNPG